MWPFDRAGVSVGVSLAGAATLQVHISRRPEKKNFNTEFKLPAGWRMALGDTDLRSVWQAWRLHMDLRFAWQARGHYGSQLALVTRLVPAGAAALCVAGVAFGDMNLHFVWQARETYDTRLALVTRLVPTGPAALCVAGMALGDMNLHFGVALGDMNLHFVWQAWHLRHWAWSGDALGRVWRLCVAGVALGDMDFRFLWQAWRLVASTLVLCGWRGTYGNGLGLVTHLVAFGAGAVCVAAVGFGDMDLRFVWQAWHLVTSTYVLRGRRGTYGTGLGLVTRLVAFGSGLFAWQPWALVTWTFVLCGRRGAW
eukprot:s1365_g1.t1